MSLPTLGFLVFVLVASTIESSADSNECSQFGYEYRVIEQLIELKNGLRELKAINDKQDGIITQMQKDLLEKDRNAKQPPGGSVYVRWGRTVCPGNGTELVYRGFTGGSHYKDTGGAVNRLCLPKDPTWGRYNDALFSTAALLYGAEYNFQKRGETNLDKMSERLLKHDVPCAVCRSIRPTMVMIPGRVDCYDSWSTEYAGYLSAGRHDHAAASEYTCIDEDPETVTSGSGFDGGILFYHTEVRCGSLPCTPYVQGRELACVVCTK